MNFADKVILITGGSSGIGAGAARHFAKLKANISIVGRDKTHLNEVADQIVKDGSPRPLQIIADVTIDAERIINDTVRHFGRLDVLINNAGMLKLDSVVDFNENDFDRIMNVNLKGPIMLTHLAVPHLAKTKGNVINISSMLGQKPTAVGNSYCISKAGLDQFTKCAAIALAPKGIRVNALNPGVIRTNIYKSLHTNDFNVVEYFDSIENCGSLVGRVGNVSDTNAAIAYLANESFVNGITLVVDGGFLAAGISEDVLLKNCSNN